MISTLANTLMSGYPGHTSGPNGTITRVVIHATVSPLQPGGARAVARYFQSPSSGGLAHYVVDAQEIVGCCDEDTACWHAPPNHGSLGVELCDPQTGDDWGDPDHQAMLALAAPLVRDICDRHQLPLIWLTPDQLVAGYCGITSHANVSAAWHQTDHTDPGEFFPVDQFLQLVTGTTPSAPSQEDDMLVCVHASAEYLLHAGKLVVLTADLPALPHGTFDDNGWGALTRAYGKPVQ